MKVYFFRHSLQDLDGRLSAEGRMLAEMIGERHGLPGKRIKDLMFSFNGMAFDTGVHMLGVSPGADRLIATGSLDTPFIEEWDRCIRDNEGRVDPDQAFIKAECVRMKWEFCEQSKALPGQGDALAVGHAGLLEALVHSLTGVLIDPLRECEGVCVDLRFFRNGGLWHDEAILIEELRR